MEKSAKKLRKQDLKQKWSNRRRFLKNEAKKVLFSKVKA